ncbi:hypothetical protein HYV83_00310 [Candidatus Woesearchaeota archaeon]|nr:hypothetical protein [Candidatus Woesearchaeota archaeon]
MLESVVEKASIVIRTSASEIAHKYGCIITSTLDVHMNEFPIFSQYDASGLIHGLEQVTAFATLQYANRRGVVGLVGETNPSHIIGVSASGRPKLLILPTVVQIPVLTNGGDSTGFVSAVGIYTLRPIDRRVRFAAPSTSVPYTER